jgi:hypothetical protein
VSASPAARAVRTACFAEQMEQNKQSLLASSQKNYPPAFHSLRATTSSVTEQQRQCQVGGTGGEQGCVGAALPATTARSREFGLEGTERVLADQVQ